MPYTPHHGTNVLSPDDASAAFLIGGLLLYGFAYVGTYWGEISFSDGHGNRTVYSRRKNPWAFWSTAILLFGCGLALMGTAFFQTLERAQFQVTKNVCIHGAVIGTIVFATLCHVLLILLHHRSKIYSRLVELTYVYKLARKERRWPWRLFWGGEVRTTRQQEFFTIFFSLLAKLTEVDGEVSEEELLTIQNVMQNTMRLSNAQMIEAMVIFRKARSMHIPFETLTEEYERTFGHVSGLTDNLIDFLLTVAHADGKLSKAEQHFIVEVATILGINEPEFVEIVERNEACRILRAKLSEVQEENSQSRFSSASRTSYDQFRRRHTQAVPEHADGNALDKYYKILGCQAGDSPEKIRRSYRVLVLRYHPDRLKAQGLGEEFRQVSEERFRLIQEAYEIITESKR